MSTKRTDEAASEHASLQRVVGVFGATMMGLGSIIGTGVFVSIGIATEIAGTAIVVAIVLAAVVATCNGLSSAELAANHPVSGGTYEYGYRWLRPSAGFTAGWMFLCAKVASAATAALGFAGYLSNLLQFENSRMLVPLALTIILVLTSLVLAGVRRSNAANVAIVSTTLVALVLFIATGIPAAWQASSQSLTSIFTWNAPGRTPVAGLFESTALMFVAYTGYGRIATLGEEIRNPRRTIPLAIALTLAVSMMLYIGVGLVTGMTIDVQANDLSESQRAAPLELIARRLDLPVIAIIVAVGAMTAMAGVLLNLILGLSRVVLAMGRRGDLPKSVARIDQRGETPYIAVVVVGASIGALTAIGDVKTTWSFSAFTVLIYYAITNLAATRLGSEERLYPRVVPWISLASCLFLAFWIKQTIWIFGGGLIVVGFALRALLHWSGSRKSRSPDLER